MLNRLAQRDVQKISSGCNITSVSAVVKELIENSVDAGAKIIAIKLTNTGLSKIVVQDNGGGIPDESLSLLGKRHHTSKISNYAQLSCLTTYGFRGEAFNSICQFADVSVQTRRRDSKEGRQVTYDEQGKILSWTTCACPMGTFVTVQNLFKNMPVRRQEAKKPGKLKQQYLNLVHLCLAYSIVHPELKISLYNDETCSREVHKSTRCTDLVASVHGVLGPVAKGLVHLRTAEASTGVCIDLFVPSTDVEFSAVSRSCTDRMFMYCNKRPFDSKKIVKAIRNALANAFEDGARGRYPVVVLAIEVPPDQLDVNCTPDKRTLCFTEEEVVLNQINALLLSVYGRCGAGGVDGSIDQDMADTRQKEQGARDACSQPSANTERTGSSSNVNRERECVDGAQGAVGHAPMREGEGGGEMHDGVPERPSTLLPVAEVGRSSTLLLGIPENPPDESCRAQGPVVAAAADVPQESSAQEVGFGRASGGNGESADPWASGSGQGCIVGDAEVGSAEKAEMGAAAHDFGAGAEGSLAPDVLTEARPVARAEQTLGAWTGEGPAAAELDVGVAGGDSGAGVQGTGSETQAGRGAKGQAVERSEMVSEAELCEAGQQTGLGSRDGTEMGSGQGSATGDAGRHGGAGEARPPSDGVDPAATPSHSLLQATPADVLGQTQAALPPDLGLRRLSVEVKVPKHTPNRAARSGSGGLDPRQPLMPSLVSRSGSVDGPQRVRPAVPPNLPSQLAVRQTDAPGSTQEAHQYVRDMNAYIRGEATESSRPPDQGAPGAADANQGPAHTAGQAAAHATDCDVHAAPQAGAATVVRANPAPGGPMRLGDKKRKRLEDDDEDREDVAKANVECSVASIAAFKEAWPLVQYYPRSCAVGAAAALRAPDGLCLSPQPRSEDRVVCADTVACHVHADLPPISSPDCLARLCAPHRQALSEAVGHFDELRALCPVSREDCGLWLVSEEAEEQALFVLDVVAAEQLVLFNKLSAAFEIQPQPLAEAVDLGSWRSRDGDDRFSDEELGLLSLAMDRAALKRCLQMNGFQVSASVTSARLRGRAFANPKTRNWGKNRKRRAKDTLSGSSD